MITPSYGLTATERILPRLALDFTTASLDPRVTFSRALNTATRFNSSGYVEIVNADLPRFDYDPIALVCKGLLIEESRTNLALQSQNIETTSGVWFATRSSLSSDVTKAPDGLITGDKLIEDTTASNTHFVSQILLTVASAPNTFSIYTKPDGRTWIRVTLLDSVTTHSAYFNIAQGTLGTVSAGVTATITFVGDGWYRCSISATTTATVAATIRVTLATGNGVITYTGDGTSGVYLWGAQLEAGAFPTSYIPTTTTSLTRNADVATMTGANFSDWYTATTGAAVVWAIPQTATGTRPLIQFDDTTANEIIALRGNVANPELYIVDGGAPQAQIDAGTIVANTTYKLSGAWNTDSCAAAQNGAEAVTDNTATIPTPTQLRIGSDGTNYASALIQKILYYPQRIIDAEVQAFSK